MGIFNIEDMAQQMVTAASRALSGKSQAAIGLARTEFPKIARSVEFIESEYASGRMSQEDARSHLALQENSVRTALLAIKGIELIAVESAVNAALDVVRDVVNSALGFALI